MRIFGIGAHKTGTTTLETCLQLLHVKPIADWSSSRVLIPRWYGNDLTFILDWANRNKYKGFSDSPWNHADFYKYCYAAFPDAKFVCTIRDSDSWFESFRNWATPPGSLTTRIDLLPDGPLFHGTLYNNNENSFDHLKDQYIQIYEKRNQDIIEFFADKPTSLLVVDWSKHGWQELCDFLGKKAPDIALPHANKGRNL